MVVGGFRSFHVLVTTLLRDELSFEVVVVSLFILFCYSFAIVA